MRLRLALLSGLAALLLAGGCSPADREPGEPPRAAEPSPPNPWDAPNRFDPTTVRVGDQVGGLQVTAVDVGPAAGQGEPVYVGTVEFAGELTVSGSYRAHPEYPAEPSLCFVVDEATAARVPRMRHDDRRVWFCFTNQEEAIRALGPPEAEGRATIVIADYRTWYAFTEVNDTARLVRVIERS